MEITKSGMCSENSRPTELDSRGQIYVGGSRELWGQKQA